LEASCAQDAFLRKSSLSNALIDHAGTVRKAKAQIDDMNFPVTDLNRHDDLHGRR